MTTVKPFKHWKSEKTWTCLGNSYTKNTLYI